MCGPAGVTQQQELAVRCTDKQQRVWKAVGVQPTEQGTHRARTGLDRGLGASVTCANTAVGTNPTLRTTRGAHTG